MGVYGNIHGAFSGLGKPSIKLEFEDNESLVAFSKKMQDEEPAPVEWNEEEGMFTPVEGSLGAPGDLYLVRDLRTRAKKEPGEVVSNKNLRFYKVEGEEVNNFNKGIYEKDAYFTRKIEGYRNIYFTLKDGKYYTEFTFFEPTKKENWNEPTLAGYWRRIGTVLDINKVLNWHATPYRTDDNLQLLEDRGRADGVIHRSAKGSTFYGWITDKYNAELRQNAFNAFYNERLTVDDKYYSKYQKKLLTDFYTNPQSYKIRSIDSYSGGKTSSEINDTDRDEFIGLLQKTSLGAPGDTYIITDTRKKPRKDLENTAALQKYDIRKFSGEELRKMQTDDPLLYEQIKSDINTPTTTQQTLPISTSPLTRQYNVIKQKYPDAVLLFNVGSYYEAFGDDAKKIADVLGISLTKRAGQYLAGFKVRDLEKNLKKLIKAGVKVAVCEQTEQALGAVNYYVKAYYPGLGKVANNALYNNLDILDYRGMQPTYRQLPNYDAFFKPATNRNSLKGFGLADTKKLIADICRNHYRECAAIAKHLKAETKLQSAFNLWHWLHHNIRYEYDREGREEVRTPARVWADRHRGVDCDCLSVLAWCVLKCMGYDPAFELAAFRNKPAYSHIYINLDGIVVDRVWYVFNSRPPFITKTELFKVRMLDNLGQLF